MLRTRFLRGGLYGFGSLQGFLLDFRFGFVVCFHVFFEFVNGRNLIGRQRIGLDQFVVHIVERYGERRFVGRPLCDSVRIGRDSYQRHFPHVELHGVHYALALDFGGQTADGYGIVESLVVEFFLLPAFFRVGEYEVSVPSIILEPDIVYAADGLLVVLVLQHQDGILAILVPIHAVVQGNIPFSVHRLVGQDLPNHVRTKFICLESNITYSSSKLCLSSAVHWYRMRNTSMSFPTVPTKAAV